MFDRARQALTIWHVILLIIQLPMFTHPTLNTLQTTWKRTIILRQIMPFFNINSSSWTIYHEYAKTFWLFTIAGCECRHRIGMGPRRARNIRFSRRNQRKFLYNSQNSTGNWINSMRNERKSGRFWIVLNRLKIGCVIFCLLVSFYFITQNATAMEVRKAFRSLSVVLHPDKNDAADANVQFRNLVSVYEVLKDSSKRQK